MCDFCKTEERSWRCKILGEMRYDLFDRSLGTRCLCLDHQGVKPRAHKGGRCCWFLFLEEKGARGDL